MEEPRPPLLPGNTLLTTTPEEGRRLAVRIALRQLGAEPEGAAERALLALVVAEEFATIARANAWWRP